MSPTPFDLESIDRLLTTTRSVRERLDVTRPVDPQIIEKCLRIAIQAPSASNVQGWRWMIVTDPDKKAAVADAYRRGVELYLEIRAQTEVGLKNLEPEQRRQLAAGTRLVQILAEMPVQVIPCQAGRPEDRGGWNNASISSFYASIWPAAWSFMLALRSRGMGSVLTTLHLIQEDDVAQALGIPKDVTQAGLIPVAYYTGDDFMRAKRQPAKELTYWNEWGNTRT